jgi:hypothetical protein
MVKVKCRHGLCRIADIAPRPMLKVRHVAEILFRPAYPSDSGQFSRAAQLTNYMRVVDTRRQGGKQEDVTGTALLRQLPGVAPDCGDRSAGIRQPGWVPAAFRQADPVEVERLRLRDHRRAGLDLGHILLNKEVALAQGVLAFALLIGMQFAVTWSSVRAGGSDAWSRENQRCCCIRRHSCRPPCGRRVTEEEARAAVRAAGLAALEEVEAVMLETVSVIRRGGGAGESSPTGIKPPRRAASLRKGGRQTVPRCRSLPEYQQPPNGATMKNDKEQ